MQALDFLALLKNRHRNGRYNGKQTVAVLGPGSWGTALSQVLNDNGHEVRLWGNIQEQIDEINTAHTNQRYFKETSLLANKLPLRPI